MFVAFQGRNAKVCLFYFLAEFKTISTLQLKLFFKGLFAFSLELKGVLVDEEVEEEHSSRPYIDFVAVAIF